MLNSLNRKRKGTGFVYLMAWILVVSTLSYVVPILYNNEWNIDLTAQITGSVLIGTTIYLASSLLFE
ncbi:MAG: hypothetical protein ACOCTT_01035 [archaeon]